MIELEVKAVKNAGMQLSSIALSMADFVHRNHYWKVADSGGHRLVHRCPIPAKILMDIDGDR